jgi:hypothetical protein
VKQERLDAVDQRLGAVGVLLAEVVRAGGEDGDRILAAVHPAGPEVVEDGVVALRKPLADVGVDVLL